MSNVAKKKPAEIVGIDQSIFENDSGLGNSEIDQDVLGIPFLKTNLSPAVLDANRGALKGDMYNTVTGEIYNGTEGVLVIPCHFQRRFIHWSALGDEQKAPIAIYDKASDCPKTDRIKKDQGDNKDYLLDGSGHYIEETHQHYVLVCKEDGSTDAVMIAMKSTSLKKSRQWNMLIQTRRKQRADGSTFQPPRFLYLYRLSTVMESNAKASYAVWDAKLEKELSNINVYNEAKAFAMSIEKGAVEVKHEQENQDAPVAEPQAKTQPPADEPLQKDIPF